MIVDTVMILKNSVVELQSRVAAFKDDRDNRQSQSWHEINSFLNEHKTQVNNPVQVNNITNSIL